MKQIEAEAKDMNGSSENARRFEVAGTSTKLWLIRAETEEAKKRMAELGSVLSPMFDVGNIKFFLARK